MWDVLFAFGVHLDVLMCVAQVKLSGRQGEDNPCVSFPLLFVSLLYPFLTHCRLSVPDHEGSPSSGPQSDYELKARQAASTSCRVNYCRGVRYSPSHSTRDIYSNRDTSICGQQATIKKDGMSRKIINAKNKYNNEPSKLTQGSMRLPNQSQDLHLFYSLIEIIAFHGTYNIP